MPELYLPKDKQEKADVLFRLTEDALKWALPFKVRRQLCYYWLLGYRDFDIDYDTGMVTARATSLSDMEVNPDRVLFEEILPKRNAEIGRLMRMDLRPATSLRGHGLSALRYASAARVLLDYFTNNVDWNSFKLSFFSHLVDNGLVGVGGWVQQGDETASLLEEGDELPPGAVSTDLQDVNITLEIIPASQLFCLPEEPTCPEEVTAIGRHRWVPYQWLKTLKKVKDRLSHYTKEELCAQDVPVAVVNQSEQPMTSVSLPRNISNASKDDTTLCCPMRELWFRGQNSQRVSRWIVMVGRVVIIDEEYKGKGIYSPIGTATYFQVGGFYGRAFTELQIPMNSQVEQMLSSLACNVKDMDLLPLTLIPREWNVPKNIILERGPRRRVAFYDQDPASPDAKVQSVAPVNSGDFPGKVVALFMQSGDRLSAQPSELLRGEAPGRIDSASALAFVHETASTNLTVPANSAEACLCQVYNSFLARAPLLLSDKTEFPIFELDDALLGMIIKPESGEVGMTAGNYPTPSQVNVGVRDKLPQPPQLRIQQLHESLNAQLITPLDFKITVWREQLDYPVGDWASYESFRKAVFACLMLFNDGEEPGQNVASLEADNFDICLRVTSWFMAKIEFQFASKAVRQVFEERKKAYTALLNRGYPSAMGSPVDEAEMAQSMGDARMVPSEMLMAGAGGMPGGMPMGMPGGGGER